MTPGEEEIASIALLMPLSLISSLSKINILEPKLSSEVSILAPLTIISLTSLAKVLFKNEVFVESIINKNNLFKKFFIKTSQKNLTNNETSKKEVLHCNYFVVSKKIPCPKD